MARAAALGLAVVIVVLAAGLRFHGLAEVDFRGDEVTYYLDLNDGARPLPWLFSHLRTFGHDRQMPLPRVVGAFVVNTLGLESTAGSVRAPFALAGVGTPLAFGLLGFFLAQLAGERRSAALRLGALTALFVAVNPYHLYWSRTAHIYVYPMLFLGVAGAGALAWLRTLRDGTDVAPAGRAALAATGVGLVLAGYAHMSTWIAGATLWTMLAVAWLRRHRPDLLRRGTDAGAPDGSTMSKPWPRALGLAIFVWGLLIVPWAYQFLVGLLTQTYDAVWNEATNPLTRFSAMWRIPFVMTWGGGWRSVLTLGLPTAAIALGWRHPRFGALVRPTAGAAAALFVALSAAQSTGFFAVRYYTPLWPVLIVLSALGAHLLAEVVERRTPGSGPGDGLGVSVLAMLILAAPALAMLGPAKAVVDLRGNPVEFSRLATTLDDSFPPGTPAVVNGMNVVRFEMRPHPPKSALATFTVPDIGIGQWRSNGWRENTEDVLRRFPDVVLVQQGRNYYDHPDVGPWEFPESYFAHQIELRNEPALRLRRWLIGGSLDFFSAAVEDSRSIIRISYNRPEDLVARARSAGEPGLVLFGEGWGLIKPDFTSTWRTVTDRAEIIVYNLTDEARPFEVNVEAYAAAGVKEMRIFRVLPDDAGGPPRDVATGDPILTPQDGAFSWRFTLTAEPGPTTLALVDALYGVGRAPLLVSELGARPIEPAATGVSDGGDPTAATGDAE
ncbi:MAG: hypothetical protein AAGM22_16620 [Acidobacteriota bacterium]